MPKGQIPWEEEDIEALKRLWAAKEGTRRLMQACRKTKSQILKKRVQLGLPDRTVQPKIEDIRWSQSQKDTLKREWLIGTSVKAIASLVEKKPWQVTNQRIALNLPGRRSRSEEPDLITVVVYMKAETERKISRRASIKGMSRSAYINRLVLRDIS